MTKILRRMFGCFLILILVICILQPSLGLAQFYCPGCLSVGNQKRWENFTEFYVQSAQNIKKLRELLREAIKSKKTERAERIRKALKEAEDDWDYANKLAEALNSTSYEENLARRMVKTEQDYDQARQKLKEKTDQFRRLLNSIGRQREAIKKELSDIAELEKKQRFNIIIDSFMGGLNARYLVHTQELRLLKKLPKGVIDYSDEIKSRGRIVKLIKLLKISYIDYKIYKEKNLSALASTTQVALMEAIPRVLKSDYKVSTSVVAQTRLAQLAAWPHVLVVGLNLVDIAFSHEEFMFAEQRQKRQLDLEKEWQINIGLLGARVQNLKEQRDLVAEQQMRQSFFKKQVQIIQKEMK